MIMKYRITTPQPGFTGVSAGVNFTDGVAVVEAPPPLPRLEDGQELTRSERAERDAVAQNEAYRRVNYFRGAGYGVQELDESPSEDDENAEVEPPAKSASKAAWVAHVVEHHNVDLADAEKLTRDQLAAQYGPKGEEQ